MDASKKQREPVAFKSLAELKRFIRPGVEIKTVSHANHADMVGLTRVVTAVQTVGFYSKIKDQPEHPFSTCNHGKGFYTDFGKAGNYIFGGTTVKVKDIGIPVRNEIADRAAFNDWWRDRSIPASRSGVREALESLGVADTKMLLIRCYGLSLSDQYWICPEGAELRWEDINFFQNDFSEDIGDVLFGERKKKDALNFTSPDSTSDGNLKKRWKIIDGKRCLIKGGSNPFRQQPFNEVIASGIMERLGIPHVSYTVIWSKDAPYSVCEDFVTEDTELIPAWRLLQAKKQKNSTSRYRHLLECCELLGIGNITPFLDRMLVLDYIIANEDRHFNNFGALRNAETLEWLGMAPIYDSGSSLGYDKMPGQMRSEKDVICKPFKNHHAEQLKLVTDFDWIDFDRLCDVDELISSVLSCEEAADYIDEGRIHAITESVQRRIGHLQELAMTQTPRQLDTTEDDVREEVAADYAPKMEL